jgi:hypothetical protein
MAVNSFVMGESGVIGLDTKKKLGRNVANTLRGTTKELTNAFKPFIFFNYNLILVGGKLISRVIEEMIFLLFFFLFDMKRGGRYKGICFCIDLG